MPSATAPISFAKYSGAGNDFAIVLGENVPAPGPAALARTICPRATGAAVDGLILVDRASADRVAARFFNPDGSEYSTCGNGTRCVARFALHRGLVSGDRMEVMTGDGRVIATVSEEVVSLDFELEAWVDRQVRVSYAGEPRDGWLVQIGTPHLVLPLSRLPEGELEPLARPIRHDSALGPQGANVDLVSRRSAAEVDIRTYERGVEAETLACGSGAMATALALGEAGLAGAVLQLHTRSGDVLEVAPGPKTAETGEQRTRRRIRLSGPALHIFDGDYAIPTA